MERVLSIWSKYCGRVKLVNKIPLFPFGVSIVAGLNHIVAGVKHNLAGVN
jgi:hypothetical protein